MIDHIFDYDNQFFRMVTIALARTMSSQIRWINYFEPTNENETGRVRVVIPFYTSLTGDERFCIDAFVDDVVDKRVTLNTDQYQRGIIIWTGFSTRSDEFANPNQYLSQKVNIDGTLRKIISKVKAVPITVNYDVEIQLATQNEVDKCSQKLMDIFYNYMFFNIDYYGIKIDAILTLPDNKTIEINREISMESERRKLIKFSLDVQTYYPIFRIKVDDLIPCDNDDHINWDYIGLPRPTNNFIETLKNYNKVFGQTSINMDEELITYEGVSEIKRVFWNLYFHELGRMEKLKVGSKPLSQIKTERERRKNPDPRNWKKENFDNLPTEMEDDNNNNE